MVLAERFVGSRNFGDWVCIILAGTSSITEQVAVVRVRVPPRNRRTALADGNVRKRPVAEVGEGLSPLQGRDTQACRLVRLAAVERGLERRDSFPLSQPSPLKGRGL